MTHVPCSPCSFTAGLHGGSGTNPMQTLDPRGAFTVPLTLCVALRCQCAPPFHRWKSGGLEECYQWVWDLKLLPPLPASFVTEVSGPRGTAHPCFFSL